MFSISLMFLWGMFFKAFFHDKVCFKNSVLICFVLPRPNTIVFRLPGLELCQMEQLEISIERVLITTTELSTHLRLKVDPLSLHSKTKNVVF